MAKQVLDLLCVCVGLDLGVQIIYPFLYLSFVLISALYTSYFYALPSSGDVDFVGRFSAIRSWVGFVLSSPNSSDFTSRTSGGGLPRR